MDVFVLFFLHTGSRKAFVAGITAGPSPDWVKQQARNATMTMEEMGLQPKYRIVGHDGKYTREFDAANTAEGATAQRVGPRPRT